MKSIFSVVKAFWTDECGAILSAEAALLGTVGVVGAGAGISAMAESVDAEMRDVAFAIRSLDQSYSFSDMGDGCKCGKAWTAGSSFKQRPVEESHAELQGMIDQFEADAESINAESTAVESTDVEESKNEHAEQLKSHPVKPKQATRKTDAQKREEAKRKAASQEAEKAKSKRDAERAKRMDAKKKQMQNRKKKQRDDKKTSA